MSAVVFLDTNTINSDSLMQLLGCRGKLAELEQYAKLVIPQVVFDELIKHKRKHFDKIISLMRKSAITNYLEISEDDIYNLSFDEIIQKLIDNESIIHEVLPLSIKANYFQKAYDLAIENKPPFDAGSDKGFKDACVAFSIEEYLEKAEQDTQIYLLSNDSRLCEYFSESERILTVENVDKAISVLSKERFVDSQSESGNEKQENLIMVNKRERADVIETSNDTEIDIEELEQLVDNLCNSGSFIETHSLISDIIPFRCFLDEKMGYRLLKACLDNDQIGWIMRDEDVESFFIKVFKKYEMSLNDTDYSDFVDLAHLPNERLDSMGNVLFSKSEKDAYLSFADDLIANIRSIEVGSDLETNPQSILASLQKRASQASLDPHAISWLSLASVFINGPVEASDGNAKLDKLNDFIALLEQSNEQKREAIINAIIARLNELDLTF